MPPRDFGPLKREAVTLTTYNRQKRHSVGQPAAQQNTANTQRMIATLGHIDRRISGFMRRHGVGALRISLAIVFISAWTVSFNSSWIPMGTTMVP